MIVKYSCTIEFEYDVGEVPMETKDDIDKHIDFEIGKAIQDCITEPEWPVNVTRNYIEFIETEKENDLEVQSDDVTEECV